MQKGTVWYNEKIIKQKEKKELSEEGILSFFLWDIC